MVHCFIGVGKIDIDLRSIVAVGRKKNLEQ